MGTHSLLKKTLHRGEYLGAFANHLIMGGYGVRIKNEGSDFYELSHPNLDGLKVRVIQELIGFGNVLSYDFIFEEGSHEQIDEFMDAAKKHLEKCINSMNVTRKELSA